MATYMAHTFLHSQEPATINMWKAVSLDIVHGTTIHPNLDEFNRQYAARKTVPQTYGWFYSQVNLGVTAVREQMKDGTGSKSCAPPVSTKTHLFQPQSCWTG